MSIFKIFVPSFLILVSTLTHATNDNYLKYLQQQASNKKLWTQTEWLNLLHYNRKTSGYNSQVDDAIFFNAENGKTDPQAELLETLQAFFQTGLENNQQAQCRFIARFIWLKKELSIDSEFLPEVACSEYREWRKTAQTGTVTMIFPAYHLNSPSSMFGHTLLRLDPADNNGSEWLSLAVNFGANINNNDNSLVYAFRGLAGGYPGSFVTQPYYKKIQEYNRIEHRDIWEYRLNLTPEETERMITHLWELKDINFDYYFFDENCSYRLLELLEVARPNLELTDEFTVTAIPVDTVRSIENAQMIESISYRPAQATEIQFKLEQISVQHQKIVIQLSEDIIISKAEAFTGLTIAEQKNIAELAYKYLRYQNTQQARNPEIAKRSHQLLQLLNSYPTDINTSSTVPAPVQPVKSHKSKRTTIGAGERLDNKYAEIGFKMSFHDLEDNKEGFLQGAQINIGNIKLRAEENVGLRLYQFDLVDIFSLTPRNAFFKPLSWKIYTGLERQLTKNKDQLTYHVTGGVGGAWALLKNHQFYTLAIFRLETNKQLKNTLEPAIGFNTGFLSHFKNTTARLEFSGEQFEDNTYRLRAQYTQNIAFSTNHSIKLFARHQWQEDNVEFSDINLSYQYYF